MTIHPLSDLYIDQAIKLYLSAFPPEERRPVKQWIQLNQANTSFHILVIKHECAFAGILTYWKFNDFIYIEHFATVSSLRGQGIGQSALHTFIKGTEGLPIVLEVELPHTPLAKRRIGFYERVGLSVVQRPYDQPPYPGQKEYFPLLIMSTDASYTDNHFKQIVSTIHREVYQVKAK